MNVWAHGYNPRMPTPAPPDAAASVRRAISASPASSPSPSTASPPPGAPPFPRMDAGPVLIVSGCDGATQRYRVFNHLEQLDLMGIPTRVIEQWRPGLADASLGCEIVILHRVAWDPHVAALVRQTRDAGGCVLFDIDDLVFVPDEARFHRGVALLPEAERPLYHDGIRRYRRTLLECDGAIVPTRYLAARVRQLGKRVWISRNCIDLELLRLSELAAAAAAREKEQRRAEGRLVVGYASGSRTHDDDFAESAGPALRAIMTRRPEIEFWAVGPLDLGPEWQPLASRVRRIPAVPWRDLPAIVARFDINLAPLEIDNPFCRAKSELKWLEAAACSVPSIATATEAFRVAIEEYSTGYVAVDAHEWEVGLDDLAEDAQLRRDIGTAAHADVVARRTTAAQAPEFARLLAGAGSSIDPRRVPPPAPRLRSPPDGFRPARR